MLSGPQKRFLVCSAVDFYFDLPVEVNGSLLMSRGFDGFEIDDFRGSDFGQDREVSRSPSSDWNKWTELHNIHREEGRADRLDRESRDHPHRDRPPLARENPLQPILPQ